MSIETGVEQVAQDLTQTLPTFTCGDATGENERNKYVIETLSQLLRRETVLINFLSGTSFITQLQVQATHP